MNNRLSRTAMLALGLVLAAPVLSLPAIAEATQFAEMTTEQFTDASTWIIQGDVVEVWTEVDDRGRVWTRAKVKVSETFKGPNAVDEIIIDSLGGKHGLLESYIPAAAAFSEHEELLAFLYQDDNGRNVPVSKFLGKHTIRRAPGDRQHVMTWHPKKGSAFDARFLPHPNLENRVYLDDMVERIQTRLDEGWDGKPITGLSNEKLVEINKLERRMPR